ncbi:MAG: S1 RNA-binding domain-containing protein [Anaerolineae bacterium]
MDKRKWKIAHDIASELAARRTDVNELVRASDYLTRTMDVDRFFRWLDALARTGPLFAASDLTSRYRREVREACQRLRELETAEGEDGQKAAMDMARVLAWSVRLMRYYETNRQLARRRSPVKILTVRDLQEGMILEGVVRDTRPFGAFVDIGVRRDGLVHISELAPWRVDRVEDVVSVGDHVRVKVLEVDHQRKRISLSMKEVEQEAALGATSESTEKKEKLEPSLTIMEAAFREAVEDRKEKAPAHREGKERLDRGAAKRAEHQRLLDELTRQYRKES